MASHVYLSPHLDDAVYSCGGLIFKQAQEGEKVLLLTICAGDPPPGELSDFAMDHHHRWGETVSPIQIRRQEDHTACRHLGADYLHLDIPDSIYRKDEQGAALYPTLPSIFGPLASSESSLVDSVSALISRPSLQRANVYVPLCFGGHVDHRLTRLAAESLEIPLFYYREFPYAARGLSVPEDLEIPSGETFLHPVDLEAIEVWIDAIMLYRSQLSTFWESKDEMVSEVDMILQEWGGIPIRHGDVRSG